MHSKTAESDAAVINQAQLVLAEKRTSLSVMRTGLAILVLPMSALSFLIATSKYYDATQVLHFFIPLLLLIVGLMVLGAYLILRSMVRIQHYDRLIQEIKARHNSIKEWID
jgi:hypothetical protein